VTCEEPELLTDIRDFNVLFYVILRCKSSKWLESSIKSGLGVPFAILLSSNTVSSVSTRH